MRYVRACEHQTGVFFSLIFYIVPSLLLLHTVCVILLPPQQLQRFVAKILIVNVASLGLFKSLGFVEKRRVAEYGEAHLVYEERA